MNPLPTHLSNGTFGELLVQIRLFQHHVQAAPPIKDSGNDLIAIRDEFYRPIQVKTTVNFPVKFNKKELPAHYHVLAIVVIPCDSIFDLSQIPLDACRIFLLQRKRTLPRARIAAI